MIRFEKKIVGKSGIKTISCHEQFFHSWTSGPFEKIVIVFPDELYRNTREPIGSQCFLLLGPARGALKATGGKTTDR